MLDEGTELGGFRIEAVLGQGGMAVVYEATQLSLDRRVALKVLDPRLSGDTEFRARFRREALLQAGLDHDHVVAVYEAGEAEGSLYIAMRLVRGPNLKQLIRAGGLDYERALRLLTPVADALDRAHETGLVHRDVKPQNILVGQRDFAYLADFGLTKAPDHTALTATGKFMGTLDYISPEQLQGQAATPASDIYAFAAVVYECLTGSVPFPRQSEAALVFAHASEPPPLASELRPDLRGAVDDALRRGIAKEPAQRHRSAGDLVRDVRDGLASAARGERQTVDAATSAEAATPSEAPTEPVRRRPAVPLGVLAALAGVLGAAAAAIALLAGGGDGDGGGDGEGGGSGGAPKAAAAQLGSPWLEEARLGGKVGGDPVKRETCSGGRDADACTLAQRSAGGSKAGAPFDGVVTRWRVRHAEGDLTFRVLHRSSGRPVLRGSSGTTRASGSGVNEFETCLPISRGDLIGISVARGGRFGVVWTFPAQLYRWHSDAPRRGAELDSIGGVELLLNADVERAGACEPNG